MKTVLVVGATQGTGRELAAEYARRGDRVVITGRDAERAAKVAAEIESGTPGTVTGLALDLTRPAEIADALAGLDRVDRVILVGMVRDVNSIADYNIAGASDLAVTKVVGYTAVVAALRTRLAEDASVLLFGGMGRTYPYPGSTTVTAVNAAVVGLVRTMTVELAPIRFNSIHTGMIVDSPFWADKPQVQTGARDSVLIRRLATMSEVVEACLFLLEHPIVNGVDLPLEGGRA